MSRRFPRTKDTEPEQSHPVLGLIVRNSSVLLESELFRFHGVQTLLMGGRSTFRLMLNTNYRAIGEIRVLIKLIQSDPFFPKFCELAKPNL